MAESTGAADATQVAATQITEPAADQPSTDGEAWRNPKEIKSYFQRVQRLEDQLGEALTLLKGRTPPEQPKRDDKPPSEVDALRAELKFRDAVADMAPHLDRAKRERLQRLYVAERPGDLDTWVRSELAAVGWDKPATTSPAPVIPPEQVRHASTGAPVVGSRGIDPKTLGRDEWMALSGDDLTKAWKARVSQDPTTGNKFAPRTKP